MCFVYLIGREHSDRSVTPRLIARFAVAVLGYGGSLLPRKYAGGGANGWHKGQSATSLESATHHE